jgi:hypothetical protein
LTLNHYIRNIEKNCIMLLIVSGLQQFKRIHHRGTIGRESLQRLEIQSGVVVTFRRKEKQIIHAAGSGLTHRDISSTMQLRLHRLSRLCAAARSQPLRAFFKIFGRHVTPPHFLLLPRPEGHEPPTTGATLDPTRSAPKTAA